MTAKPLPQHVRWGSGFRTVDQTNDFRHFAKSFGRAFSKARAVEGAQPSSKYAKHTGSCLQLQCPAGIEKAFGVSLLCIACNAAKRSVAFVSSLCAYMVKEKNG